MFGTGVAELSLQEFVVLARFVGEGEGDVVLEADGEGGEEGGEVR